MELKKITISTKITKKLLSATAWGMRGSKNPNENDDNDEKNNFDNKNCWTQ